MDVPVASDQPVNASRGSLARLPAALSSRGGPSSGHRNFVKHIPLAGAVAYLTVVGAVSVWGCSRGWRMALRMDDFGVTVHNYFRTYRFAWSEVCCLATNAKN